MALFNLTDIKYKTTNRVVDLGAFRINNYSTTNLRYPIDLGSTDKGHYMMIHVHVQDKTAYQINYDYSDPRSQIQKNRAGLFNQTGATNLGGVAGNVIDAIRKIGATDAGQFGSDLGNKVLNFATEGIAKIGGPEVVGGLGAAIGGAGEAIGTLDNATFLRTTKRTTDSIALYMPDTLAFTDTQSFNQLQMGGENAAFFGAAGSIVKDSLTSDKFDAKELGKNLTPFMAQKILGALGSTFSSPNSAQAIFAGVIGGVQNPQLELLYGSPDFRSFQFQFMFYPRSEKEALDVQKIIQRLKFHQAPEIMTGTAGYFMVPPSEFDIEFHYNGEINPNIPSISTCALTSMSVDYAPGGFRAYEVPGPDESTPKLGKTGMPVGIRLDLTFRELEIMTKFNYQRDEKVQFGARELRSPSEVAASAALGDFPG